MPTLIDLTPGKRVTVMQRSRFHFHSGMIPAYLHYFVPVGSRGIVFFAEETHIVVQFLLAMENDDPYAHPVLFYEPGHQAGREFFYPDLDCLELAPDDAEIVPIELDSECDPIGYAQDEFEAKYSGAKLYADMLRSKLGQLDRDEYRHAETPTLERLDDLLEELDKKPFALTEWVLQVLLRTYYHPKLQSVFEYRPSLKKNLEELLHISPTLSAK